MGGRHQRDTHLGRKLSTIGLCLIAIIVLFYAFARPTRTVSNAQPMAADPRVDVALLPTSRPTMSPSHHPTRTTKARKKPAQGALRAPVEKDQDPALAAPLPPPRILAQASSPPKPPVARVAPPASSPRKAVAPPVMKSTRATIEKQEVQPPKSPTKTTTKATAVQTVPRVASPSPKAPTVSRQVLPKAKATTVVAQKAPLPRVIPPVIPLVTSNSKCANIGLLTASKAACNTILAAFPQIKSVLGMGGRAGNPNSCHPKGLAIDFIVGTDKALGDKLYAFVIARRAALGASPVVLWQVADHFDHVHVSFDPCKG